MSRSVAERIADVRRVLDAARKVAHDRSIVPRIAHETGLSPANVELGLSSHLEHSATDDDLAALVHRAGDAPRVHVILSANVFVAALRAVALARAASDHVTVRPSRRDPVFARALVESAASPAVVLGEDVAPMDVGEGEIHVYGRTDTIARVRAAARPGVRVRGHGPGMGVAVLPRGCDLAVAAADLARDVVPFDQRGCLSPRVALVLGDEASAAAFGQALHEALASWQAKVPRGALTAEEKAESARYASTMAFAGRVFSAPDHLVGVATPGSPLVVPPPGRHVHIACVSDEKSAADLLRPLARAVVTLGTTQESQVTPLVPAHARVAKLGEMQRPPLDGPVDLRDGG
jgi:hypothetical protein